MKTLYVAMRRAPAAMLCVSVVAGIAVIASELTDDLKARRAKLMERLGPESLLILRSAPEQTYSRDVQYEYRQDSDLYYLTDIDQAGTILIVMPGNETRKEILFIRPRDPLRETWDGRLLTPAEARERSGIETVLLGTQFEEFLAAVLSRRAFRVDLPSFAGEDPPVREYQTFFDALAANRARVAVALEPRLDLSGAVPPTVEFANRLRERFFGFTVVDAARMLGELRQIKTPYEQRLLEQSGGISSEAHLAAMRAVRPGTYEYQVEAALEAVYLARGGSGWSYPSIVASGPNATTLHYDKSTRKMEAGDLLLIDAAANYKYVTVDITRTYPVSGTFSTEQRAIYEIVVNAQNEGMKAAQLGSRISDIEARVTTTLKEGLLRVGLITDLTSPQYRTWYMHRAVHFIGIDVHDPGDYTRPLAPGMAFVIEPGIYVRENALDELPPTPENAAFKQSVRLAFDKYKNIGVRIEDSFLLTDSGLKSLSAKVPRTIEEIERVLASRRP